ncbi:HlyD family secretion protein [Ferrimonas aestuarii]|uniref:HlyD family efflux transporter periplasmic adaptor subunit n=1 Tax=Ferrimonas aestuarii TaxID=2569539 RepID=A0A4U1BRZ6_9GAMM|nr:efflux RND transporter periplasmic adaptor subunit [Ferrimonas aestuarii]TKB57580.1 HlyD family efflux transporter periplasmic adaptor subunit [Ferrimonas aestuarii]
MSKHPRLSVSLTPNLLICAMLLSGCGSPQEQVAVAPKAKITPLMVSGTLESSDSFSMSPPAVRWQWQYQVKYLAPEGKTVAPGERLVVLDSSELQQRLTQRQSDLASVEQDIKTTKLRNEKQAEDLKLQLAEAKMELDKAKRKYEIQDDSVAALEREKYQRDAVIAQARVELITKKIELEHTGSAQRLAMLEGDRQRWQLQVDQIQRDIAKMTITAPRAGMVVRGTGMDGTKLKEGATAYVGEPLVRLPNLDQMEVRLSIPEVEAKRVSLGQQLVVRLDASPDREFVATITEISPIFRRKNQDVPVVVFDAVAQIAQPDPELMRPGMTTKVEFAL